MEICSISRLNDNKTYYIQYFVPILGWKLCRYKSSSVDAAVVRTFTPPIIASCIATLPAGEAPFKTRTDVNEKIISFFPNCYCKEVMSPVS